MRDFQHSQLCVCVWEREKEKEPRGVWPSYHRNMFVAPAQLPVKLRAFLLMHLKASLCGALLDKPNQIKQLEIVL